MTKQDNGAQAHIPAENIQHKQEKANNDSNDLKHYKESSLFTGKGSRHFMALAIWVC